MCVCAWPGSLAWRSNRTQCSSPIWHKYRRPQRRLEWRGAAFPRAPRRLSRGGLENKTVPDHGVCPLIMGVWPRSLAWRSNRTARPCCKLSAWPARPVGYRLPKGTTPFGAPTFGGQRCMNAQMCGVRVCAPNRTAHKFDFRATRPSLTGASRRRGAAFPKAPRRRGALSRRRGQSCTYYVCLIMMCGRRVRVCVWPASRAWRPRTRIWAAAHLTRSVAHKWLRA